MTLLLDTHIWIWWLLGSQLLPWQERAALDRLAEAGSLRISAMSLWEAQMLHAKGRLRLDRPVVSWIREASASDLLRVLPLDVDVVIAVPRDGPRHARRGDPQQWVGHDLALKGAGGGAEAADRLEPAPTGPRRLHCCADF